MALREFTDEGGQAWRVWDVMPENLHPTTRTEDYLRDFLEGWLAFETVDGTSKRRLHPVPRDWDARSVDELVALLEKAEPVQGGRTSGPHGLTAAEQAANPLTSPAQHSGQRTFRFPGGRFWSVAEWPVLGARESGGPTRVLRFSSGSRMLQLESWPADWESFADEKLAELLARSFPRPPRSNPTDHHRRASDRPPG